MESRAITEGTLLWEPSDALKSAANVTKYMAWLKEKKGAGISGLPCPLAVVRNGDSGFLGVPLGILRD